MSCKMRKQIIYNHLALQRSEKVYFKHVAFRLCKTEKKKEEASPAVSQLGNLKGYYLRVQITLTMSFKT